jgi:hypothetical protein
MSEVERHEARMELMYAALPSAWEAWLECINAEEEDPDEADADGELVGV